MKRRSFFKRCAGLIASVAIAQQVVRNWAMPTEIVIESPEYVFNPTDYAGEWFWFETKGSKYVRVHGITKTPLDSERS